MRDEATAAYELQGTDNTWLRKLLCAKREWESTADVLPYAIFVLDGGARVVRANAAAGALDPGGLGALLGGPVRELLTYMHCDIGFDAHWKRCWEVGAPSHVAWSTEMPGKRSRVSLSLCRIRAGTGGNGSSPPRAVLSLIEGPSAGNAGDGRLFDALEEERRRIAVELHDGIGQSLTAVRLAIEGHRRRNTGTEDRLLRLALDKAREAMDEARRIAMALRPAIIDDLGLLPAIAWLCRELRIVHPNIVITERIELNESNIDGPLRIVFYRLIQEALNNAVKHAAADHIDLRLSEHNGKLALTVADNGRGLPNGADRGGFGLSGMAERVERSGGELAVSSETGRGTAVTAVWPRETSPVGTT